MVDIPEQAIEAAQNVIRTANWEYGITDADMAKALTAAAPYMQGAAREQSLEEAAQIVEVKLTQAMTGHSVVGRMLHVLDGKLIREIAAAIRALKSNPVSDGWQPIEYSTPRDQVILAWGNNWHWEGVEKAYLHIDYNGHKNVICRGGMAGEPFTLGRQDAPTHWHPIPPAPQTGGGDEV